MTELDIDKAFAEAIQTKEFKKHPAFKKQDRYDLKNSPTISFGRKLETLFKLGKITLT